MRTPTDRVAAWDWWRQRIAGVPDLDALVDEPRCGLFEGKSAGRRVPVSIDLAQEIDPETGELIADERFVAVFDGLARDAYELWAYICETPISEAEHARLTRMPKVRDLSREVIV
jgi:hypothetical protein